MNTKIFFVGAGIGALTATAYADTVVVETPNAYAWNEPRLASDIGVGVALGGGITGFTDQSMRDRISSDVGGLWDLRVSIGTHIPIGIELGYVGTAQNLRDPLGNKNGSLIGTTAEGALRYNLLPHEDFTPYIFAGVGWQRYDVTDRNASLDTNVMMQNSDNLVEFPVGVGFAYRDLGTGLVADVRGTFRAAGDSNLVVDPRTGNNASLHTWEASAAIGYEF